MDWRQATRRPVGSRRAVIETGLALSAMPADPLVRGGPADSELLGDMRGRVAGFDASDQELTAEDPSDAPYDVLAAQPRRAQPHGFCPATGPFRPVQPEAYFQESEPV